MGGAEDATSIIAAIVALGVEGGRKIEDLLMIAKQGVSLLQFIRICVFSTDVRIHLLGFAVCAQCDTVEFMYGG